MEFTFVISWPALFFFIILLSVIVPDFGEKKSKEEKISKIESDNITETLKKYHQYFEKEIKKMLEKNQSLEKTKNDLLKRIHTMETRSMTTKR